MADQAPLDAFGGTDPNPQEPNPNPNPPANPQLDVFVEKLMTITDETGRPKYDSIEKALDALNASQAHIKRLEDEAKARAVEEQKLRDQVAQAKTLEDVIKKLGGQNVSEPEKQQEATPPNSGLSEEQAAELVRKVLQGERQTEAAVTNLRTVNDTLKSKFGDKAPQVVAEKAKELGTTPQQLKELSATNPNMVLALFGNSTSSPSATTSSLNLGSQKPQQEQIKRPEKSLISGSGATDAARMEHLRKIRENVYKKYGVET